MATQRGAKGAGVMRPRRRADVGDWLVMLTVSAAVLVVGLAIRVALLAWPPTREFIRWWYGG